MIDRTSVRVLGLLLGFLVMAGASPASATDRAQLARDASSSLQHLYATDDGAKVLGQ